MNVQTSSNPNPNPNPNPKQPTLEHKPVIAFALGGLGGFNAHGAGFLKAALEEKVSPQLISCTSGQIYFVWRYLLERDGIDDPLSKTAAKVDLRKDIEQAAKSSKFWPKPLSWLDSITMAAVGDPGIFEPARENYLNNLFKPYVRSTPSAFIDDLPEEMLNRLMPAQLFNPTRPAWVLTDIGKRIASDTQCGILFNAYAPKLGEEILYINEQAQQRISPEKTKIVHNNRYGDTRVVVLQNPQRLLEEGKTAEAAAAVGAAREAVDNALWLYFYGFEKDDGDERSIVDGAYHRQVIVSELAPSANLIFSVKPQNNDWNAQMPKNALQVQNFTTQLWFNASYSGETARIDFINQLVAEGVFQQHNPKNFRTIRLETVEYSAHIRFFDFFVERLNVYQAAYQSARGRFQALRHEAVL